MVTRRRVLLFFPLIIAVCAVLGGIVGPGLVDANAASPEDDIRASLKSFTKVLDVVQDNFAEQVTPDKSIYNGAIPGMLRTLDPHSNFSDPKAYKAMREDQRGRYFGVGMTVGPRNGKTIVIAPFGGSPAYKAGIRPGDVILEVNDKRTDNLSTTEIAEMLKGDRNTPVQVVIAREGAEKPITFNIIRDEIPRRSVEDAYFLKPGIVYLTIKQFNENTSREMTDALKKIGEKDIKGLVLDLRDNPGGLLNEGVAVVDHFVTKGQTIVSHRGRSSPEKVYTARYGNQGRDYPIVVLVNRYSASAAEIVAGALQDHDRAWIVGDTTFGKGLVQTVYPLAENTALALTTAHFYTPSGRLIQRDYSNISFYDYYYRRNTEQKNPQDVKMTDSGRTVYGGGGITPDEKFSAAKLNPFQIDLLLRKFAFFNFTAHYFSRRETKLPKGWEPDEAILNEFHQFLVAQDIKFSEADYRDNLNWVKQQLRREIYVTAFSYEDSVRVKIESDPEVLHAVESLPKARTLQESAKKMIVQRMNGANPR